MNFKNITRLMNNIYMLISNYLVYIRNNSIDQDFEKLLYTNWLISRKNRILKYYEKNPDANIYYKQLLCLKKNLPYQMTVDVDDYHAFQVSLTKELETLSFDSHCHMYYVVRNSKKLYFKKSMDNRKAIADYYEYLAYEQSSNSPHAYTNSIFKVTENDIIADVGAAEGIFALDNIDIARKIYLFEYDDEWIEALEKTFLPYKNKVNIINKKVASITSDTEIALDDYFNSQQIDFIKMDVEGSEKDILVGMQNLLTHVPLKLTIASYHNAEDESYILECLNGFDITRSDGYLLCGWEEAQPPFFRTGVIRAVSNIPK